MDRFVAVIMAGGRGQRFWPLSTESKPKQFLDLERCGRTLIQSTFDRVAPLTGGAQNVVVATAERYVGLVREQLPELPAENLIVEPVGRDSGPAIALASLEIHRRYGAGTTIGFFSSDHLIRQPDGFADTVRAAAGLARERHGLVTIGIEPDRPSTGYGYIACGEAAGPGFRVERFVEKPNLAVAERYLAAGSYLWNAGIFVWQASAILEELELHAPDLLRPLRRAVDEGRVAEVFPTLPKISIDYAVMEHTERAFVVPGGFGWDDIGDWVALERLLQEQEAAPNTVIGRHVGLEASGNIVYTEGPDDTIVTLGVEGLVIVKRGDTVLIVRKDRVQDIKTLLEDERLSLLSFD